MKQVIVVRSDLNMRRGKESAQCAHACLTAVMAYSHSPNVSEWLRNGGMKIVVSVSSESDLLKAYDAALDAKLPCALIKDAGKTEFKGTPTFTSCAIGPADADQVDAITSGMKLR